MKKLLLIRHAKAVHNLKFADFERPLTHSGIKDAEMMSERLHHEKLVPQKIITSPAIRTLATANILTESLSLPKATEDLRIYEANRLSLLEIINEFDNKFNFIGIVGHNPTIEQMSYYLSGETLDFPTCAMVLIKFEFDNWELISSGTGDITWHTSPKTD